uniref:NLP1 n=1 Tax=Arundo donax TaxID=35708 RepID=A0A0A9FAC0_ARUDO
MGVVCFFKETDRYYNIQLLCKILHPYNSWVAFIRLSAPKEIQPLSLTEIVALK